MKRLFRILLGVFIVHFTLIIFSCEKVIEIDDDPAKKQLVLNAVPSEGKRAFVYFANTRFFLDPSNDQPVDDVAMTLYVNGVPYTPDSVAHCKYFFPYTYAGGDSLKIDASSGERQVHAQTYVPLLPDISNIDVSYNAIGHTFRYYKADFDFQDHAGVDEYYNLRVMVRDSGMRFNEWTADYDTVDTIHSTYFLMRSNPEITGDASYVIPMMNRLYTRNLFNDSEIDGLNYHVGLEIIHLIDTNEVEPFKHEYFVSLESVTPARLRYIIDISRQASSNSFFTEQTSVRGNVDGALGIFAGSAKNQFVFWPDTLPATPTGKNETSIITKRTKRKF